MSRRWFALAFICAALLIAAGITLPVWRSTPTTFEKQELGADLHFTFDATTVLFDSDCVTVHWQTEHIVSVHLNGRGVAGSGDGLSCVVPATIDIAYQDGTTSEIIVPIRAMSSNLLTRLLMIAVPWLLGAALIVSGVLPALGKRLPTRRLSTALRRWLPGRDSATLSHVVYWTVVLIVLVGAAVRSHFLSRPLGSDEARTYISFASQPLSQGLSVYWTTNNHLFNTFLIHEAVGIFGAQLWTLRLPVFFAGVLSIAAAFAVGRRFYGTGVGLVTAALVAGASWLIEYSVNARAYTLMMLFFLLLLLLATVLRRRRSTVGWLLFALLSIAGLYAIPTMVYPLGIVCLWLGLSILLEARGRQRWLLLRDMVLTLIFSAGVVALLYLPVYWYLRTAPLSRLDLGHLDEISAGKTWLVYQQVFGVMWSYWHQNLLAWIEPLLLVGVAASVIFHRQLARYPISLLAMIVILIPTMGFIEMTTTYERLWLFLLPIYLMLASAGLLYLWRFLVPRGLRPTRTALAALALGLAVAASIDVWQTPTRPLVVGDTWTNSGFSSQQAVLDLRQIATPDDFIICAGDCGSAIAYGMMYGLNITNLKKHMDLSAQPFYLFVTEPMQPHTLDPVLEAMKITPEVIRSVSPVYNRLSTTVYRLELVPGANITVTR